MSPTYSDFQAMFALSAERGGRVRVSRQAGHLTYRASVEGGQHRLIVFAHAHAMPRASRLEEIGEDAGFFDPRFQPHPIPESDKAVLITEGLAAAPCTHQFGFPVHFDSRLSSGMSQTCGFCRVTAQYQASRRGQKVIYSYDGWGLRESVWQRWIACGPPQGSLQPQEHHKE